MKDSNHEHFVVSTLRTVFIALPLVLAGLIWKGIGKIKRNIYGRMALGTLALIYLALYTTAGYWGRLLNNVFHDTGPYAAIVKVSVYYVLYILLGLPIFVVFAYGAGMSAQVLRKPRLFGRNLSLNWIRRERLKSDKKRIFLGGSLKSGKPIWLTDEMRVMHTQVVGSTGSGKTESVMLPMLAHDIRAGKGAIILDGKGDLDLRDKIWWIMHENKRQDDFHFFSLSYPELSHSYNPLLKGNATEIKDKIIGSTVWTEEFYKKKAEEALLKLLRPLVALKRKVRFSTLYQYLTDKDELERFSHTIGADDMRTDIKDMVKNFGFSQKFLAGIIADLVLTARSEFASLVDVENPAIDLLDIYNNEHVVYFQLNVQGYEETARRMGRLILQDIKTVSNTIQSTFKANDRHFFGVFVDEFGSFVHENFIEFLNKARGAGFAVTMLHQSLGDLIPKGARSFGFQQQVIENTNLKIVMRQDDPYSVERFVKIAGTKPTLISTYQTAEKLFGKGLTGVGSLREGQTFHIEPDLIRTLKRGEAVFIRKQPTFHVDHLKLDFFGHPGLIPEFQPKVKKEEAKERIEESQSVPVSSVLQPNVKPAQTAPKPVVYACESNLDLRVEAMKKPKI